MAIPTLSVKAGSKRRIRILHLSDLHFTAHTNPLTEMSYCDKAIRSAKADLGGEIELILVTGDLVDHSLTDSASHRTVLETTRSYLLQVAGEHCLNQEKGLVVVPGNHDYRWSGNIPDKDAERIFQEIFADYFSHRLFAFEGSFPVFVGCFDSNKSLNGATALEFARGAIDVALLDRDAADFETIYQAHPRLKKIALVHHHPLPVPAAERTIAKRGWIEKYLKVPLGGAPEYLLLRNAGVFLHKLLESEFQLVLHGHLHEAGYWRVCTTTSDGHERWLEVVSGASILDGAQRSFNAIELSSEGVPQVKTYAWNPEGLHSSPKALRHGAYDILSRSLDLIPVRFSVPSGRSSDNVSALSSSEVWIVDLDNGDLETIEYAQGYHSLVPDSQKSCKAETMAQVLHQTEFIALKLLPHPEIISIKPQTTPEKPNSIDYEILFDPALTPDSRVDVISRSLHRAALYVSVQDKALCGDLKDPRHEEISQSYRSPKDRAVIRLRFRSLDPKRYPTDVKFQVLDPNGDPCEEESSSAHVVFDYWNPNHASLFESVTSTPPEAILTVSRPRPRYKYILKWSLPSDPDPPFDRPAVRRMRKSFAKLKDEPGKRQQCQEFLAQCLKVLKSHCASSNDVVIHLFAFDDGTKKLTSITNIGASSDDPLTRRSFRYGEDVIGSSFRQKQPLVFRQEDKEFKFFRRTEKDILHYLIAFPLILETFPDLPAGVVAFASQDGDSTLYKCCENKNDELPQINQSIQSNFHEVFRPLFE